MIPYNTDAPLYHFPLATLALIVLNVVFLVITPAERIQPPGQTKFSVLELSNEEENDSRLAESTTLRLSLDYGQGLKPWQWFTAMFMHNDVIHLILNLISLWAFGLVVEGKVGSLVFFLLYMGIGVSQAAIAQTVLSFGGVGGSLGANAAILGLLGIAMVWAPRNDFDVFWSFGLRGGTVEIPILVYGFIALGLELLGVIVGPFAIASGVLHLLGLAFGFGLGLLWLKRRWVDCEGWDLISVYHGVEGKYAKDHEASEAVEREARALIRSSLNTRSETPPSTVADIAAPRSPTKNETKKNETKSSEDRVHQDLDNLITAGNYQIAFKLMTKLRQSGTAIELTQPQLGKVIRDLLAARDFSAAIPFLTEHIERFEVARTSLQLNLAKIFLHLERPHRAANVLRSMPREKLDENSKATWSQLAKHAKQQIDSGVIELSD